MPAIPTEQQARLKHVLDKQVLLFEMLLTRVRGQEQECDFLKQAFLVEQLVLSGRNVNVRGKDVVDAATRLRDKALERLEEMAVECEERHRTKFTGADADYKRKVANKKFLRLNKLIFEVLNQVTRGANAKGENRKTLTSSSPALLTEVADRISRIQP